MITGLTRRHILTLMGGGLSVSLLTPWQALADTGRMLLKPIPASGENIPVIGMGTWQTFNVGSDPQLRLERTKVLNAFFAQGGRVIDCAPMYGSSAEVLGFALTRLGKPNKLFAADKVWSHDADQSRAEVEQQAASWGVERFDLIQIHNLLSWRENLPALQMMKQMGKIRYVGITTSHGRRHDELQQVMANEDLDFVQLTYNITHREVEQRLLPLAREKGIAVIANRPYDGGNLIKTLKQQQRVPAWATAEFNCQTWADFLLKFVVSHPAITCAIPATTQVAHMNENMQAGYGPMPDAKLRQRMIRHIESL
jgi:diketogulonate reductase-like aldo/keto reductase